MRRDGQTELRGALQSKVGVREGTRKWAKSVLLRENRHLEYRAWVWMVQDPVGVVDLFFFFLIIILFIYLFFLFVVNSVIH